MLEDYEITKSKLSVYEETSAFKPFSNNDLLELSMNSQMRSEDVDDRIRELEHENQILKMKNKDEMNTKLLQMEQQLEDAKRTIEKYK